jgi:hypothetical protein
MQYNREAKRPSFILPPGDYPAQIVNAEEKQSKKGNPMLVVKLNVFNTATGGETKITDYMVQGGEYSADWRIKELVEASGIEVSGDLNPYELNGRNLKVRLKIKPPKGDFGESNAVVSYMPWGDADGPQPAPKSEADIPF